MAKMGTERNVNRQDAGFDRRTIGETTKLQEEEKNFTDFRTGAWGKAARGMLRMHGKKGLVVSRPAG